MGRQMSQASTDFVPGGAAVPKAPAPNLSAPAVVDAVAVRSLINKAIHDIKVITR